MNKPHELWMELAKSEGRKGFCDQLEMGLGVNQIALKPGFYKIIIERVTQQEFE